MNEKKSGGTSKQTLQTLQTRKNQMPPKISFTPCSLLPTPYSLFPIPYSLLPIPHSL
ncbi:MAG: hypothetical protein F6K58_16925 [Symploca sp. SIO2E9]|nr:hypothetical protein [Symploca sp. SIO2E9]